MKMLSILIALLVGLSAPSFAAQKGAKVGKKAAKVGLAIKKIDANSNHQIDGNEVAVLKEKFSKAPADNRLKKRLDRNTNGQLDDNELAALNKRLEKKASKGDKKDRKGLGGKKKRTA
jgi:hypothetical protein